MWVSTWGNQTGDLDIQLRYAPTGKPKISKRFMDRRRWEILRKLSTFQCHWQSFWVFFDKNFHTVGSFCVNVCDVISLSTKYPFLQQIFHKADVCFAMCVLSFLTKCAFLRWNFKKRMLPSKCWWSLLRQSIIFFTIKSPHSDSSSTKYFSLQSNIHKLHDCLGMCLIFSSTEPKSTYLTFE